MGSAARLAIFLLASALLLAGFDQGSPPEAGEVTALLPRARIERGSAAPFEAHLRDPVFWRDWFETEARARARLELLDGSLLNIGSSVRMQVVQHDRTTARTELELEFGKIRAVVKKRSQPGSGFTVRTPQATVGVIGTHVYVDSTPTLTTVINFEGRVGVRNADRSVVGEGVLEPFELAEVEPGQPPRKRLATVAELLRALEDTLPGLVTRLQPQQGRVGSCLLATSADSVVDPDGDGLIARLPFLEVSPRGCAGPGITPVRVCVPETSSPGLYEYALPGADGAQRWGAFLVQPPAPLAEAQLRYLPELPPGATHYARLVGRDNKPLAGVPVRVRYEDKEKVLLTDEGGAFPLQAPASGILEFEVGGQPAPSPLRMPGAAPEPIRGTINVVDRLQVDRQLPEFSQQGQVLTVPGEVRTARLEGQNLPVLRTVTRAGRIVSGIPLPLDASAGSQQLVLEDEAGQRRTHRLRLYEILRARLDQRQLLSGAKTQGEFLVCIGSGNNRPRKVRARILAVGPVRFRGKGSQGKKFERTFKVTPSGLLPIPFRIQAEKGAPGAGIPFLLTLHLESD